MHGQIAVQGSPALAPGPTVPNTGVPMSRVWADPASVPILEAPNLEVTMAVLSKFSRGHGEPLGDS